MRVLPALLLALPAVFAQNSCTVYDAPGECIAVKECEAADKTATPNFCPKDAKGIQCCTKKPAPKIPTSNCKDHVVGHGETILKQFAGDVHVVWCYANKSGEHGKGLALDFMVGGRNPKGQKIAEWVQKNYKKLDVMYIIWGQKIWNPSRDDLTIGWDSWRKMEDRGDDTSNHWDHPHVSFNAA